MTADTSAEGLNAKLHKLQEKLYHSADELVTFSFDDMEMLNILFHNHFRHTNYNILHIRETRETADTSAELAEAKLFGRMQRWSWRRGPRWGYGTVADASHKFGISPEEVVRIVGFLGEENAGPFFFIVGDKYTPYIEMEFMHDGE